MSIQQNFSNTKPSLSLNFARSKQLDSRVSFTRSSSATYMDDNGLIVTAPVDSPRFDHDPVTGDCLGLLIEESRTNLLTNSTSAAAWINGTFTTETTYPIFGLNTVRITNLSIDGDSPSLSGAALSAGTYTASHYIDTINSTSTLFQIYLFASTVNGNNSVRSGFDLSTKTFGGFIYGGSDWSNPSTNVVNCGNGIYRVSITATLALSATLSRAYVNPSPSDTSYAIVAGSQLESGAFATSYIPTSGSTVTRSADTASITGTNFSSWFNPSEGTINIAYRMGLKTSNTRVFQINNSATTFQNVIDIVSGSGTGIGGYFFINTNNVQQGNGPSVTNAGYENTIFKVAGAYKENDLAAANNKTTTLFTDGVATLPSGLNRVVFGQHDFTALLCGHLLNVSYYPKRLTNDQLQNLTK